MEQDKQIISSNTIALGASIVSVVTFFASGGGIFVWVAIIFGLLAVIFAFYGLIRKTEGHKAFSLAALVVILIVVIFVLTILYMFTSKLEGIGRLLS